MYVPDLFYRLRFSLICVSCFGFGLIFSCCGLMLLYLHVGVLDFVSGFWACMLGLWTCSRGLGLVVGGFDL